MAISLDIPSDDVITLEEYIDHVNRNVDLLDIESIAASGKKFRALMNNRRIVTDMLNRQLKNWDAFQGGNSYTAQTFMLGGGNGFFVRVNIWTPPSHLGEIRDSEQENFYYQVPHDHNFTFMTGGYLGQGYETSIWEYEHDRLIGVRGEPVELRFLENTSLPAGKIMIYRKSVDVHSQGYAKDFSISLNLMVIPNETVMNRATQFIFDTEKNTVRTTISSSSGRVLMCDLAKHVGDANTSSLLDALAQNHADSRVRASSTKSLAAMHPDQADSIYTRGTRDKHPYVRHLSATALDELARAHA